MHQVDRDETAKFAVIFVQDEIFSLRSQSDPDPAHSDSLKSEFSFLEMSPGFSFSLVLVQNTSQH